MYGLVESYTEARWFLDKAHCAEALCMLGLPREFADQTARSLHADGNKRIEYAELVAGLISTFPCSLLAGHDRCARLWDSQRADEAGHGGGRLPGHMNVILFIPFDVVKEMDEVNAEMDSFDVAIVLGPQPVIRARRFTECPRLNAGEPSRWL